MAAAGPQAAELRRRTVVAGALALGARVAQAALYLGSSVVLARLLTPDDFGVFAMAVPLWVLGSEIGNRAFQTALVQRPRLSGDDVNGLFRFALAVNVVVAGAMVAAGWALALLYGEPRVAPVTTAWAALPVLLAPTAFREALLKRDLRFTALLAMRLVSLAVGIAAGIAAAWRGAGWWSLPIQVVAIEATRAAGMRLASGWRARRTRAADPAAVAAMRRAWRSLVGLALATWVNEQPDLVAVGRLGGAPVLGLYDTARRWSWYPFVEPFFALGEVAVASFSRAQDDPDRFRRFVTRGILVMLAVSLPAVAFVGTETSSVIRVLLGDQWSAAVPYVRWLSIAVFAGAVARVTQWIYLSLGTTRRLLHWSLAVQGPVALGAALAGFVWGPLAVAAALAAGNVLVAVPAVRWAVRGTPLAPADVLGAAARPALASLAGVAALLATGGLLPADPGLRRLAAGLAVHLTALTGAWLALPGGIAATRELAAAVRELR